MSTIFTKMMNGKTPCTKVYEDDLCFAFLDKQPVTKWHTILIPKEEYIRMTDLPQELLSELFQTAAHIMNKMKENLEVDYVHLSIEGTEIAHFHIHLIPNYFWRSIIERSSTNYTKWEAKEIAQQIMKE